MRVAVLDDYQNVALVSADWWSVLSKAEVITFCDHCSDNEILKDRLQDMDVIVLMRERTPIGADLLDNLPNLKLIVTTGPSNAVVDVGKARENGVIVCGTGGYIEQTVELTWSLILGVARNIVEEVNAVRNGRWQVGIGTDLNKKTLGIVGLGRIGSGVAAVGKAFGMRVIAWSENLTDERAQDVGVERVSKSELFEQSDFVTLHLVLSERTKGIVGQSEIDVMKESSFIINTSRGPLIDELSLITSLSDQRIGGAALDVFDQEPLPEDHPFRSLPNVLATPHIGYVTKETYQLFFDEIIQDIDAFLDGKPIRIVSV